MQPIQSKEKLTEHIALVQALLNKQKLIESMVHQNDSRRHEIVESLVHRQHLAELDSKLKRLHTADIAYILEILPQDDRMRLWHLLVIKRGGDILLEVSEVVRKNLLSTLSNDELTCVLQQMDGDDLAYIADDIPEQALQTRLASLSTEDQHWLKDSLNYDEDSVGQLMSNEMIVIQESDSLQMAEDHFRSLDEIPVHNDKLLVVNQRGILTTVY